MLEPRAHLDGIKALNKKELDLEIESIKDALRTLVKIIDKFGFAYWPLFERLEAELELRESIDARMTTWRET